MLDRVDRVLNLNLRRNPRVLRMEDPPPRLSHPTSSLIFQQFSKYSINSKPTSTFYPLNTSDYSIFYMCYGLPSNNAFLTP